MTRLAQALGRSFRNPIVFRPAAERSHHSALSEPSAPPSSRVSPVASRRRRYYSLIPLSLVILLSPARADERELRRAEAAYRAGEFDRAIGILEPLVADGENPGDVERLLGHAHFERGRRDAAREWFAKSLARGRFTEDVLLRAASIAREDGDAFRAAELLRLAALVAPARRDIEESLARIAVEAGDSGRAIALFEAEIARDPTAIDARLRLGRLKAESGDERRARELFRETWYLSDGDRGLARIVGDLSFRAGDLEDAIEWYERALTASADPAIEERLARALWTSGDLPGALRRLEESVARLRDRGIDPSAELLTLLGRARIDSGRVDDGVAAWNEAARRGDVSLELARYLAVHAIAAGRDDEATSHIERWIERDPESLEARLALARAQIRRDRMSEARRAVATAIAKHGVTTELREVIEELARRAPEGSD
jgi:tetratricopeptide (TPR) repeat protein